MRLAVRWDRGTLFHPARQFFVTICDFTHHQPGIGIAHRLGSEQDFFGTCSKAPDQ